MLWTAQTKPDGTGYSFMNFLGKKPVIKECLLMSPVIITSLYDLQSVLKCEDFLSVCKPIPIMGVVVGYLFLFLCSP